MLLEAYVWGIPVTGRQVVIVVGCIICILALACGSVLLWEEFLGTVSREGMEWWNLFWFVTACLSGLAALLACVLSVGTSLARKLPWCVFLFGLCSVGYFAYFGVYPDLKTYYGLWISLAASLLIATGALWELIQLRGVKRAAKE